MIQEIKLFLILILLIFVLLVAPVLRAKYAKYLCQSLCSEKKYNATAKVTIGIPMTCECLKVPTR